MPSQTSLFNKDQKENINKFDELIIQLQMNAFWSHTNLEEIDRKSYKYKKVTLSA